MEVWGENAVVWLTDERQRVVVHEDYSPTATVPDTAVLAGWLAAWLAAV